MKALINQLKSARMCGTPLLAISTPDQPAVKLQIVKELNGDTPVVTWDRVNGFLAANKKGVNALEAFCAKSEIGAKDLPFATCEPHNAFRHAVHLPAHTILVAYSFDRFLREEHGGEVVQAILNLRDLFKVDQRTLVGLSPSFNLPVEIQHDVILLEDPLPEDAGYASLIEELYDNVELKKPAKDLVAQGVRTVRGLSTFEAEQVLAMAIASTGMTRLDLNEAWKLKVGAVSKVPGLSMTLDGPDAADLRGLDNIIGTLDGLWDGPQPPELVVRVDEIDKSFAGTGANGAPGDNTGISQDMHQQFLTNMEGNGWLGALLFGVRGGGKTVLTEAIGKKHGVPTIAMDTGAMKGGIVGVSETRIRDAFRTIKGIGGKRVLVLATCNRMDNFSPELLRRFKLGTFYFDLLTAEERAALWPIYLNKYEHGTNTQLPNDEGWTGAEIRNCCEMAYLLRKPVKLVGETLIVPFTKSNAKALEQMRAQAEGQYFSASYPGPYRTDVAQAVETKGRQFMKGN
jgi:ATPase family associated with various cellular activities (AAA)